MFLNVLRVAATGSPAAATPLAAALTASAARSASSSGTAPLSAALGDLGWTPTFAASGVLTAVLAIARRQPAAGPAGRGARHAPRRDPPHAAPAPGGRPRSATALWVHFALTAPFVTLTGLWAFPYLVQGEGLARGTAAALLAAAVLVFGVSRAGARRSSRPGCPHRRGTLTSGVALTIAARARGDCWPGRADTRRSR